MPQRFDLDDASLVLIIGSGAGGGRARATRSMVRNNSSAL
jgi:hypothetical protein